MVAIEEQGRGIGGSLFEYVECLAISWVFLVSELILLRTQWVSPGKPIASELRWAMRILGLEFLQNMILR